MKLYQYKVLHVPSGGVHNKQAEFESEPEFHRKLQEYNRKSALEASRLPERVLWIYYTDEENEIQKQQN